MLAKLGSDVSGCSVEIVVGLISGNCCAVSLYGKQKHQKQKEQKKTEKYNGKKSIYRMSATGFRDHEAPPSEEFSVRTLTDGRRLEPFGTYSTINLLWS